MFLKCSETLLPLSYPYFIWSDLMWAKSTRFQTHLNVAKIVDGEISDQLALQAENPIKKRLQSLKIFWRTTKAYQSIFILLFSSNVFLIRVLIHNTDVICSD